MDEDTLAKLWETTLGGDDWESADPQATYRPVAGESDPSVADVSRGLPLFSVAQGDEGSQLNDTQVDVSAPTLVGADLPVGDESSVPTLVTPALGDSGGEAFGPAAPPPPPSSVYELREVIGKGGMGVVYRARQTSLGRDVAIKTIKSDREGERWRRKFVGEAHATGRLAHPNIVPVYDLGQTPDGDALLAMKLVDGTTWKRLLHPRTAPEHARAERAALEDHLRILDGVCNAVAFAHSRGLVHCDLKPENVLIGDFGEVLVMDWGLALDIGEEASGEGLVPHKTDLETPCGTPAYMAPELARGEGARIGPWTDVYLLGAVLGELLSGKPPHRGGTVREIVTRAMLGSPPELPEDAPPELRAICLRAMAADPDDRFQSVGELQQALQDYLRHKESRAIEAAARDKLDACRGKLAGDPAPEERDRLHRGFADALAGFAQARLLWVENQEAARGEFEARLAYAEASLQEGDLGLARSLLGELVADSPPRQAQRRILERKVSQALYARERAERSTRLLRRGLVATTLAIVVGLAVGTGLISAERDRAERNAERAERAAAEAEEARARAEAERGKASARLATALVAQGDMLGAGERWTEARASYGEARQVLRSLERSTLPADLGLLVAQAASPSPWLELPVPGGARAVAFSSDGSRVVSLGGDGAVVVWDAILGRRLHELRAPGAAAVALAVSQRDIVAVASGRQVLLWDLAQPRRAPRSLEHEQPLTALAFGRGGERLMAGDTAGGLTSWALPSCERLETFEPTGAAITGLTYRGDIYAFACDAEGRLTWWNAEPASVHWRYRQTLDGPTALVFRPVAAQLAVASDRSSVQVWEWHEQRNNFHPARELQGHTAPVMALAYSPDGARLVSASLDRSLRVWDAVSGAPLATVSTSAPQVGVAVSSDGARVAAAGQDGRLRVWDLGLASLNPTGAERPRAPLPFASPPLPEGQTAAGLVAAALSPDRELAATGDAAGRITVWDARVGRALAQESWHADPLVLLRFLGAGERLLSVDARGTCRVWDLAGMFPLASLADGHQTNSAAVSADGRRLILGGRFGVARVYAIESAAFRPLAELEAPLDALRAVALDARGRWAVLGGAAPEEGVANLSLWDTERGAQLTAFGGEAASVALSKDGRRALVGGPQGEVTLWDLPGGEQRFAARAHTHAVHSVALVREATLAVSASSDGSWRVWSTEDGQELRAFPGAAGLSALAVTPRLDRVLTAAADRAALLDLERGAKQEATRARLSPVGDAESLAAHGAWCALRGDARTAVDLLERARQAGRDESDLLWRCHWELGHHRAALDALKRAPEDGPTYARALRLAELERLEALEGSALGREPDIVHSVAISPDGRHALTSSDGRALTLWELVSGRRLRVLRGHDHGVLSVAFSPDGARIASGDRRGHVRVWDLGGATLWSGRPHTANVNAVAFSADGVLLFTGGYDGAIVLHAADDGAERGRIETKGSVGSLAIAPDGAQVAVSKPRGEVAIVALPSGEELRRFKADRSGVRGLAYTPEGLLVGCWMDKTLQLWDPARAERLRSFSGHWDGVYGLAVSGDGARAASVGGNGSVILWDLASGEALQTWDEKRILLAVALGPRGERVLVGARDGTLRVRTRDE